MFVCMQISHQIRLSGNLVDWLSDYHYNLAKFNHPNSKQTQAQKVMQVS